MAQTRMFCPSGAPARARLALRYQHRRTVRVQADAIEGAQARRDRFKEQFAQKQSMDPVVSFASQLPASALTAGSAFAAAGAAFLASKGAQRVPLEGTAQTATRAVVAVAAGGAVTYAGARVKTKRGYGAGVEAWNALVDAEDPSAVDKEAFSTIRERFGQSPEVVDGIKKAYFSYLMALIPPGNITLSGDEHVKAREFLDAVGLPDEEAAPVHIDVGRSLFRQNIESSDREGQVDGVKAFQKLVYVSSQLFGEFKSGHLTPWTARFDVTPESVYVARRNGARMIFEGRLHGEHGGIIPADADALRTLAEVQNTVGLSDDACAKLVSELLAADTEATMEAALKANKTRGDGAAQQAGAMTALDELLARSRQLEELGDAGTLPGVGALTIKGTKFAHGHNNELVDLYTTYLKAKMAAADTSLSEGLQRDLAAIGRILALPESRLEESRAQIINDAYSKLLRDAVKSGRMDASESPASVLNELITRVGMPGEAALAMHETFYQAKLRDCLADKKIDDADAKALERTARLLCLSSDIVERNDLALKGDVMRTAARIAMAFDLETFGAEEAQTVARTKSDLRLTPAQALGILKEVGQAKLAGMINSARNKGNKIQIAKALKEVVFFSNIVLTPLVAAVKEPSADSSRDDAMKEIAETLAKARKEVAAEEAREKAQQQSAAGEASADDADGSDFAEGSYRDESQAGAEATDSDKAATTASHGDAAASTADDAGAEAAGVADSSAEKMKKAEEEEAATGQKEIVVGEEVFDKQQRLEIYKTYLTFCMTGDVITLPMGGTIVLERDQSEFTRLSQLGDILALSQMDVYSTHQDMAEQAFKSQAENMAPGGNLSPEGAAELKKVAAKMGISDEKAAKVVRGVTNKRLAGNLQEMQSQGQLTLPKVLELVEQDIDITGIIGENSRMQLYEKHIAEQLSSGAGTVDAAELTATLPSQLQLDGAKAKRKAQDLAKGKVRPTLVQAMAYHRTKDHGNAVKYMNNLLACVRVNDGAAEGLKWDSRKELIDMYGLFCTGNVDEQVRGEMASALAITEEEQASMHEAVDSGVFDLGGAQASSEREAESFF